MAQPTRTRITAQAYFDLPEYQENDLIQLINGEVVIGMPPIPKHQDIVREILVMLTLFARKKGGKTYDSPIEVRLDDDNIFQPDVLYISPTNKNCTVGEKRIIGAPDLVVEILSPSTAKYDRQVKYHVYEANGVQEYWIVDPAYDTIEVFILEENTFKRLGVFDAEDTFTSSVLGEDIRIGAVLS